MAWLPDLSPVTAGEIAFQPISFASRLASGETLATVQAAVQMWPSSTVTDAHASALLIGTPFLSGSSAIAVCGGAFSAGVTGFQPSAVYSLWASVTTSLGQTLENFANFATLPETPPAFASGGPLAPNEFSETASFTPAQSGTYYLNASGLTLTVPSGSVGGDILVVDKTGAPNLAISGTILNAPGIASITAAYATFTLRWSAKYSGYVLLS